MTTSKPSVDKRGVELGLPTPEQWAKQLEDLQHENQKLRLRLDACLYSMVLMQGLLRAHEKNTMAMGLKYVTKLDQPHETELVLAE